MNPIYDNGETAIHCGHAPAVLRGMPAESVQCCVCSPPYWNLRDYGIEPDVWGDGWTGCLGLEPTPTSYVKHVVEVFREVRRVLRKNGTLWLNLGDSYAAGGPGTRDPERWPKQSRNDHLPCVRRSPGDSGLKLKDLVGIPWMVALALRDDGWYLRADIIWSKLNPMPESCRDRPTKAHEYLFLLAKGQRKTRVIELANLDGERFHFFKHCGLHSPESPPTQSPSSRNHPAIVQLCVHVASAIFNVSQSQQDLRLPPFYAEVWQYSPDGSDSDFVRRLPVRHRPAALAARFLMAQATTKEFLSELRSLGITLPDRNNLLIGGIAAKVPLSPPIYADGERAVAIQYASEICKFDFLHNQIIVEFPGGCNYFYDAEAVREPNSNPDSVARYARGRSDDHKWADGGPGNQTCAKSLDHMIGVQGRNKRSVWTIPTKSYKDAHFATYPPALVEPCIRAGTSARGACPDCGAPWLRVTQRKRVRTRPGENTKMDKYRDSPEADGLYRTKPNRDPRRHVTETTTIGWRPGCECNHPAPWPKLPRRGATVDHDEYAALVAGIWTRRKTLLLAWSLLPTVPCVVLDPFLGSGTTLQVARWLGRRGVGIERKAEYIQMARKRIAAPPRRPPPRRPPPRKAPKPLTGQLPLFPGE